MRAGSTRRGLGRVWLTALLLCAAAHGNAHAQCADYNDDGFVTAADALGILRVATGGADCDEFHCDVDGNGAISAGDALRALKMAVGQSIDMECPDDPGACLNDTEFFFEKIWTPIQTDCVTCHVSGGIAGSTRHVLWPETEAGYLDVNFEAWRYLASLPEGRDLLLTKPQGINHGGGQRLGITPDSVHYAHILELFDRFDTPITHCEETSDFWADVSYMSDLEVLHKAAMIFAARRPTEGEIEDVADGGEPELRQVVRRMMAGDAFETWLMEAANDQLLTDKYLIDQSNAFGVLKGPYEYPDLYKRIESTRTIYGEEKANKMWGQANDALAREPLRLFVHIAKNEKRYTEIVTADYMMVNPFSAPIYRTQKDIQTEWEEDLWREGHNLGYRITNPDYEHAGVLTSPMFMSRFPSTATNRNRHRARMIAKFFLALDIEKLAQRTVDPAQLDQTTNPTMNNPACTVCHAVMDPMAGTLQNFGDDGLFLQNDTDSLPWSYKNTDLYEHGDRWYRDMRAPGFGGVEMPYVETNRSVAWLGRQIAADPRFARGAVEFWYQGLFGRKPLERPTDPSRPDYRAKLGAWVAQDALFTELAARFRDGTAGTARDGVFNLKDLLVELAMSPWFRAEGAAGAASIGRATELEPLGFVRLLTPEQLDRKFASLTGETWAASWDPERPYLTHRYRLFYGGIDSSGITARADELNALMSTVPQRLANEMACPLAVKDFSRSRSQRRLFPYVDPHDIPGDPAADAAIRSNIAWLLYWLLGEVVTDDDPEVTRVAALLQEVRALRVSGNKNKNLRWGGGQCQMDFDAGDYIDYDEHHTIRAWIAVLSYMLSDFRFIYE